MTNPITPPPELLREWCRSSREHEDLEQFWRYIATQAAQWGADQELEACCEWIPKYLPWDVDHLRAARRPKPPSLKEQALNDLDTIQTHDSFGFQIIDLSNIRRALEALPND
jgi:hypothetical protein